MAVMTPCPSCGRRLAAEGDRATCPGCGLAVRFIDVPERPCPGCGRSVALPPGRSAVRCDVCSTWQAIEPGRRVVGQATCPRCRRDVEVPLVGTSGTCLHCGATMSLRDTI